ncbi:MAG: VanW family protein [Chloroflexi bacterium]|nr:VanW family protein [Chloroflexota bacterium]
MTVRGYIYQEESNPWTLRIPLLAITGVVLLFFVLLTAFAGYQWMYQDKIYPGVSTIYGVNVAGMTRDEARIALRERFTYDQDASFVFHFNDQSWEMTASELGVSFDIDATVNQAYNIGRERGIIRNMWDQFNTWRNGTSVVPVITYNQSEAEAQLDAVARSYINQPVIDATITIQNGAAVTSPSQVGRSVDVPATLDLLETEITRLSTRSEFNLVVNETAPTVWETNTIAEQINIALDPRGVTFYVDSATGLDIGPWTATPQSIENMLRIERIDNEDGTARYEINITDEQVRSFLERIAPELRKEPLNARFIFNDSTERLEILEPSQTGREVNVEATVPEFRNAVFSTGDRAVPISFIEVPAVVNELATAEELGITELIQSGTTYFVGSTVARRTNLTVAASKFHGLVIPPNSEFSFNQWLGDVSLDEGYEQALIIYGNQTITGVGGGVCQVSTTAFQTAFYAGFPILERYPHGYRVGYYETGEGPGMDATVYEPVVDFRFLNDTPYHLLIETYANPGNSTLTFRFYSTDTGRTVTKDGPYIRNVRPAPPAIYRATPGLSPGQAIQVDYAVSGSDVYVYRTVRDAEGEIIVEDEEFVSHYIPWPAQFQVAPGDPRAN